MILSHFGVKYFINEFKVVRKCVKPVESLVPPALPSSLTEVLNVALTLSRPLLEHIHCLIVTLGAKGILVCGEHEAGSVDLQPRRQKKVRLEETWLHVVKKKKTHTHTFQEGEWSYVLCVTGEAALCCPLPSTDSASWGDGECFRSRRQVQKKSAILSVFVISQDFIFTRLIFQRHPSLFPSRLT